MCNVDAAADWLARSTAPGVVWCHDFRSDAEVNAFRWTSGGHGNDPNSVGADAGKVRRVAGAGPGGKDCLEIYRNAGSKETDGVWWRPFAPIVGTANGRGVDDPGAGTITPRAWNPSNANQLVQFPYGYYGNASYHSTWPGHFDGTGFYLQVRVWLPSAGRHSLGDAGNNGEGKILYLTTNYQSLTSQEINTNQPDTRNYVVDMFRMYRSGSPPLEQDTPGSGWQAGNERGICDDHLASAATICWQYGMDQWNTLLYHIVPGLNSGNDTIVEVWGAHQGETTYHKLWNQTNADLPYDDPPREKGQNALLLTTYANGGNIPVNHYHRYAEIIFSKGFIPCPAV